VSANSLEAPLAVPPHAAVLLEETGVLCNR
jgi:hypothetical protein